MIEGLLLIVVLGYFILLAKQTMDMDRKGQEVKSWLFDFSREIGKPKDVPGPKARKSPHA
jgi:hypothetical protein